ncbi:metal ABC transporter substrate-binding protein [candidate division KSB1 bacterium]
MFRLKHILIAIMAILVVWAFTDATAQRERNRYQHRLGQSGKQLKIVCSFADYAAITEYITGGNAEVHHISHGEQDPHFVLPKPSYAMMLSDADMWVTTGLDLEQWSTTLLDKARNKQIMDGETGFVAASDGVNLVQKMEKADRTEGDIHMMGNPHIQTGPLNLKVIAKNVTIGLMKIDPENSDYYQAQRDAYCDMIDRTLFGDELIDMFGGETLCKLLENRTLFTFLEREYEGEKLINKLGGWLKKALPFRGKKVMAYHKNWAYFANTFGLEIAGYIEPKPGIPPSAKHVQNMIKLIKDQDIKLMLVASYFEKKSPQMIESKTGVKALYLPIHVGGIAELEDSFALIEYWIDQINMHIE